MAGSWIDAYTLTCAAGVGIDAVRESLSSRQSGLRHKPFPDTSLDTWLGPVPADLSQEWPEAFDAWDSRNNRLAWMGLAQDGFHDRVLEVMSRFGSDRIGLVMGTSTASIGRTEEAYRALTPAGEFEKRDQVSRMHNPHSTTDFLAEILQIKGPALTLSTACSSSAKALASADRWLEVGICDAVLVAGVDSLCLTTIHGFDSLQLVSRRPCRPFDDNRDGLNIGEAAALALLTRDPLDDPRARLLGSGESCDAYHMSSPHPDGLGAQLAMRMALRSGGVAAENIGYVNLHGTGTRTNDSIESRALAAVLQPGVPASSTKGWTGHTLGAAGLVEAVLAMDVFTTGILPANLNLETPGRDISYPVLTGNVESRVDVVMSNSFGFGGTNCVLLFGRPG